jgi:hypothetical protein
VVITSLTADLYIAEVQVYPCVYSDDVNVADSATATATSPVQAASRAIDGAVSTDFQSSSGSRTLTIALGPIGRVCKIVIINTQGANTANIDGAFVQISVANVNAPRSNILYGHRLTQASNVTTLYPADGAVTYTE